MNQIVFSAGFVQANIFCSLLCILLPILFVWYQKRKNGVKPGAFFIGAAFCLLFSYVAATIVNVLIFSIPGLLSFFSAKNHPVYSALFGAFSLGILSTIGAFIGFGLITAFFLETGWTPNAKLAKLITPILNYLLPILIGHTGGKMFGGDRGGVIGALVTMGAIVAVDGTPMFLAAMILGPISGVCIKKFDQAVDGKIPSGFEMIVNNFSLGIIGAILCCFAMLVFGPVMETVTTVLTNGVNWIVAHNALPLSAIFVEPAKVLFLNNALDHGIFGPIGYEQVKTLGHSALFLLVPNPGAGLGLLLAYWFFGKGEMKEAAPGMILIHFFGGIHEVYFPYVLANPLTIVGMIAGGIVGTGTLTFLNVGTVATPSPGSIFSVVALSPKNCMFGVLLSVVLSCVVSFLLNSIFVKRMVAKGGDTSLGESVIPKEALILTLFLIVAS